MFSGESIKELVALLKRREVILFHSCQLRDFHIFLEIGGLPSRKKMDSLGYRYTGFESDGLDKENQVWDKVFCNPLDFGTLFARSKRAVPTVYGPIAIAYKPDFLLDADNVAICLRTAGTRGFDRYQESLKTIEDVDKLFKVSFSTDVRQMAELQTREKLKEIFGLEYVSNPEISCTFAEGFASFDKVAYIYVDNYTGVGTDLVKKVRDLLADTPLRNVPVRRRISHGVSYNVLAKENWEHPVKFQKLCQSSKPSLKAYADGLAELHLASQWDRYAAYLYNGTITYLKGDKDLCQPAPVAHRN